MGTYIALLRGINVGGHNKLPMKDLAAMFDASGCGDVRTYIQSGNAVFAATKELAARIPAVITDSIHRQFGYEIPVVLRSAEELAAVVEGNPFAGDGTDERELYVAFLAGVPDADGIAELEARRSPPERLTVAGREIYLHFPRGVGSTKLTNALFDAKLKTVSTVRNWRTTRKLLELASA